MQQNEIKNRFKEVFNGQMNPLTPIPVSYGCRSRHLYEIAKDDRSELFGVTVIDIDADKASPLEFSRAFSSLKEAKAYVTNRFREEDA